MPKERKRKRKKRKPVLNPNSKKGLNIFEQGCRSKLHKEHFNPARTYHIGSQDYDRVAFNNLLKNGDVTRRMSYICDICLSLGSPSQPKSTLPPVSETNNDDSESSVQQYTVNESVVESSSSVVSQEILCSQVELESPISQDRSDDSASPVDTNDIPEVQNTIRQEVKDMISLIQTKSLNEEECAALSAAIGASLELEIFKDSELLSSRYKKIEDFSTNLDKYLSERPKSLVDFLANVTKVDVNSSNKKKIYALAVAVEQLYAARNLLFVGPVSFGSSVVKWTFSGSSTAHTIDSTASACGSVSTLKKFFAESASTPNLCPSGDIHIFADNTQRKGRTSRVKEDGTTPIGIATNVVFINPNKGTRYQYEKHLSPSEWFYGHESEDWIPGAIMDKEEELNRNIFRPYRHKKQVDLIGILLQEDKLQQDPVSAYLEKGDSNSVCPKCSFEYDKQDKECPSCQWNPGTARDRSEMYNDVPNGHSIHIPSVTMGEIIGVNPNAIVTIKQVLIDLLDQAGIGENREWGIVGFDGVPYMISWNIIATFAICSGCKHECLKSEFSDHLQEHEGESPMPFNRLERILLVPGAGHMEKNLLLAIFKMCKDIFMKDLAVKLGFRSQNAIAFIINCGDHHLSYQILTICFEAIALELIRVYIQNCDGKPTANGFVTWRNDHVQNANFNFMYDLAFNILLGVKLYRAGIRRNNSDYALAGRQKVVPIFFLGKHQIYKPLVHNDMKIRVTAPDDVESYLKSNESFSRSGDSSKGEGGDYVTEVENKHLKGHLPPGVPTLKRWVQASRNHANLQSIRKQLFERLGIKDPAENKSSVFKFDLEVLMFRSMLRESKIFENPYSPLPLRSLSGEFLHPDLVNMYFKATSNYEKYVRDQEAELEIMCITYEDEKLLNDMNTWRVDKIRETIRNAIQSCTDQDVKQKYSEMLKLQKLKSDLINFHFQLQEELERERALGNVNECVDSEDEADN